MSADQLLRNSDIPVWKYLIDGSLTTDERISLITDLCSDRDVFGTHKTLSVSDAQSVVDVIDKVLVHSRPLTWTQILRSRRVGVGWHATGSPEEVPGHIEQDMQSPRFDPSVNTDSTLLRSDGRPAI